MGQQQLLLLVLGVVTVSVALFGGIEAFQHVQREHNRDAMAQYMLDLGNRMVSQKMKPRVLGGAGGGGKSWNYNIFHEAAQTEEGPFVDTPYGKVAFRYQNQSGHLIGWPNGSAQTDVIVVGVYKKEGERGSVRRSDKTWMGKARWLQEQGLLDESGSFND